MSKKKMTHAEKDLLIEDLEKKIQDLEWRESTYNSIIAIKDNKQEKLQKHIKELEVQNEVLEENSDMWYNISVYRENLIYGYIDRISNLEKQLTIRLADIQELGNIHMDEVKALETHYGEMVAQLESKLLKYKKLLSRAGEIIKSQANRMFALDRQNSRLMIINSSLENDFHALDVQMTEMMAYILAQLSHFQRESQDLQWNTAGYMQEAIEHRKLAAIYAKKIKTYINEGEE